MSFEVETEAYTGPIGLLLSLISAQKVDLWQLSISDLIDAYLAELDRMREMDLEIATEFLVVASALLELKCRRLFPSDEEELDEEFAFFEERDLLLARLLEVKAYRDASQGLVELLETASSSVPHVGMLDEPYLSMMPDILTGITPDRLARSLNRLLVTDSPESVDVSHLPEHPVAISQAAREVLVRLMDIRRCSFALLMESAGSRFEIVVGFLAILELYRQSRVLLDQENSLGEISIQWTSDNLTPDEIEEFLEVSGFHLGDD